MKWLDLNTIKQHLRITEDYEDSLLQTYGDSAEETVLQLLNTTYSDLLENYSYIPANIKHATLMLVEVSYKYRAPIGVENMNLVPYTFDMLLKPYMIL